MALTSQQLAAQSWHARLAEAEHALDDARDHQLAIRELLARVRRLTGVALTYRDDLDDVNADELERRAGEQRDEGGPSAGGRMGRTI